MSISYKIAENICLKLNKLPGGGVKSLMFKGAEELEKSEKLPGFVGRRGINVRSFQHLGFRIFRFSASRADEKEKRAILFLPGGGGMTRATRLHYDTAIRIAKKTGILVYLANYPLAPKYNVRDALAWLEDVYEVMLKKHSPKEMILMGDSAGANLILSLTYRLEKKPGKLIVISPACGLEYGKNRNIRLAMEPYDPILNVKMNDMIAENWCRNVPLDSSDISPEYIDYKGFPPMFFLYGKHELFYPHVMNYLAMLKEEGVDYKEDVREMCHDWALCSFFPEGRVAIREMCEWI